MTRVLLTGAGGFVGSHVLRHLLVNTDWKIVCPVTFQHKGNGDRINSVLGLYCDKHPECKSEADWLRRVDIIRCDLTAPISATTRHRFGQIDQIWNVASESHVDRSITDPAPFIESNTKLILNLLEYAREVKPALFLQMSTDEVYGPAYGNDLHAEWSSILPSNPYSASKAAQEAIAISYWRTYGVPLVITNTMNIIGEMQDPEKFIPKAIRKLHRGEPVTVHVSPDGQPGSRFYLHARNLADAWLYLSNEIVGSSKDLVTYKPGSVQPLRFNVVGEREVNNIEMVRLIRHYIDPLLLRQPNVDTAEPYMELVDFHSSRPGHDLRYALDGSRIASMGWKAPVAFGASLRRTVEWTLMHPEWMDI